MLRLASRSTSCASSAIASFRAPRERFNAVRTIHSLPVYYFPDNPWLPPESFIAGASSLLGAELKSLLEESRFAAADFRLLE